VLGALGTSYRGDEIEYIQYCQWVRYLRAHPLAPNHDIVAQSFHLREGGGDFAGDACDFFSSIKRLPGARQKLEIVTGDLGSLVFCAIR